MRRLSFVRSEHKLYRVLPDWLSPFWGFQVRNAAPAPGVNRTGPIDDPRNFRRSWFTAPWQWFWLDLLALRKYLKTFNELSSIQQGDIIQRFLGMTGSGDAFNNSAGTDVANCYPTGETDRGEDPKIDPLICGGAIVEGLEISVNSHGREMVRLRSFDQNETPPPATLELLQRDPRILAALTVRLTVRTGKTIGNFPHLGGLPVPYPYITAHPCWFYHDCLEEV